MGRAELRRVELLQDEYDALLEQVADAVRDYDRSKDGSEEKITATHRMDKLNRQKLVLEEQIDEAIDNLRPGQPDEKHVR